MTGTEPAWPAWKGSHLGRCLRCSVESQVAVVPCECLSAALMASPWRARWWRPSPAGRAGVRPHPLLEATSGAEVVAPDRSAYARRVSARGSWREETSPVACRSRRRVCVPLYGELLGVGQGRDIQLRAPCRGQSPTSPRSIGGGARCARHQVTTDTQRDQRTRPPTGLTGGRVGSQFLQG